MATLFRALLLIGLVAPPVAARAQVSCGDVLDRGIASLTADLDCTGSPGPAIILTKSVLKLSGFTIRGGTGIVCEDRCSVRGPGAVEDSAASGVWSNIPGRTKISLSGVEVRNNALWGVAGCVGPAESQSAVHVFKCLDPDSRADVKLSTVLGNGSPACAPGDCADVASCARPRVRRSICGTSHRIASGSPGESWGSCALD